MRTIHLKILPFGICLLATGILADAVPLQQQAQSFTITLEGSVAEVTPLFGPVREREWAQDWTPHFIHPAQGGQEEGAVFTTTSANGQERLWLLTTYNVEQGKVEYVVITHGFTANQIKIQITPDGEKQSKATITYRHSALAPEGNEEVGKLSPDWAAHQRVHWESAINSVLKKELRHD